MPEKTTADHPLRLPAPRWMVALAAGSAWKTKTALACIALSLLTNLPYYEYLDKNLHHWSMDAHEWRASNPLSHLPVEQFMPPAGQRQRIDEAFAAHLEKTDFRITMPLLGHLTHTGRYAMLIFPHLAGFAFFFLIATISHRIFNDRLCAILCTAGLGVTNLEHAFFGDVYFGDGVAYAFLAAALCFSSPWIIIPSVLAASFTDERALIASSLVFVYWTIKASEKAEAADDGAASRRRENFLALVSIFTAWVLYFALRTLLTQTRGLHIGTSEMLTRRIIFDNIAQTSFNLFQVFEAAWAQIMLGFLLLWKQRRFPHLLLAGAGTGLTLAVAFTVLDFSRSVGYAFPALAISWLVLRNLGRDWLFQFFYWSFLVSLLLTNFSVCALRLIWCHW